MPIDHERPICVVIAKAPKSKAIKLIRLDRSVNFKICILLSKFETTPDRLREREIKSTGIDLVPWNSHPTA